MNRRGFTIVELIIVIAIMGILLVLAVVNLRGSQVNARDEERKTDVESIAFHLETFYDSGTTGSTTLGRYPSTGIIGIETTILRDIDLKLLSVPGQISSSLRAATNSTQTIGGVTIAPSSTNDIYLYQPMKLVSGAWSLCTSGTDECRKFNLYYWRELTNTVVMLKSKNQ